MAMTEPTPEGRFGRFGGRFVPETLIPACEELEAAFREAWSDPAFVDEFHTILRDYGGRPSPLSLVAWWAVRNRQPAPLVSSQAT